MSDALFKRTEDCAEIVAADDCRLRELVHPDRDSADVPYSLAVAYVEPGASTATHRLTEEDELYYFVEGSGSMRVADRTYEVAAGDMIVVPRGRSQALTNTGSERLRWLNVVSPPWCAEHDLRDD